MNISKTNNLFSKNNLKGLVVSHKCRYLSAKKFQTYFDRTLAICKL